MTKFKPLKRLRQGAMLAVGAVAMRHQIPPAAFIVGGAILIGRHR